MLMFLSDAMAAKQSSTDCSRAEKSNTGNVVGPPGGVPSSGVAVFRGVFDVASEGNWPKLWDVVEARGVIGFVRLCMIALRASPC